MQAVKLLGLYAMIKLLQYAFEIILIAALARYVWLDVQFNHSIITNQIKADVIHYYQEI